MIKRFRQIGAAQRKRRTLDKVRREFESCGYRLDGVPDSQIEAALMLGESELNAASLSAKTIYLALRRLSLAGQNKRKGKQISGDERNISISKN
jgi:hypothetical protein